MKKTRIAVLLTVFLMFGNVFTVLGEAMDVPIVEEISGKEETLLEETENMPETEADMEKGNEGEIQETEAELSETEEHVGAEARWLWPVPGSTTLSGGYSASHAALDVIASSDVPIVASKSGTIVRGYDGCKNYGGLANSGVNCLRKGCTPNDGFDSMGFCNFGFGNGIVIDHGDGTFSHYAHMSRMLYYYGTYVTQGQVIGYMGASGQATGRHLHFSIGTTLYGGNGNKLNNSPGVISYIYSQQTEPAVDFGTGFYAYIINTERWKHLTVESDNNVVLGTETGAASQVFQFTRLDNGSYKIINCANNLALDVHNASAEGGANVKTYGWHESPAQRWKITGTSGAYRLSAECTECVLDVANADWGDGTNIQMCPINGNGAQYFQIWKLPAPSKPAVSATVDKNRQSVILNWNPTANTRSYDIRILKNGKEHKVLWGYTATSCEIPLDPGTYQTFVCSCNNYSYTSGDTLTFTIPEKPVSEGEKTISMPKLVKAYNTLSGISVQWGRVVGADGYYVYRKYGSGGWKKIKTITSGGIERYNDTGVKNKNGSLYTYTVRAYRGNKASGYSKSGIRQIRLNSSSISKCNSPSGGKVYVRWGKNSRASGYQIQYSTSSKFTGAKYTKVKGANALSKTLTNLTRGKRYYVRVRSYKVYGGNTYCSVWSRGKSLVVKK